MEKDKKGKKKGKKKKGKASGKLYKKLSKDLSKAKSIAEKNFDLSDLSRVDDTRPGEVSDVLAQQKALSDPFSPAYVGQRSDQLRGHVGRLQDALQGYDSRELQALREARRRETERGFQSGQAALARGQGNLRVGSTQKAAQLADLARGYGQQSADAENDLFIQGAAEKRRANTEYGDVVRGYESDEFGRSQQALKAYQDNLGTARADELARQKINLGQEATDRASQSAAALGILGIKEARQNAKRQNKLIREGYASNERISQSGSGQTGQTSQQAGSSLAEELAKLAEENNPNRAT